MGAASSATERCFLNQMLGSIRGRVGMGKSRSRASRHWPSDVSKDCNSIWPKLPAGSERFLMARSSTDRMPMRFPVE